ncbi:MAG: serine hydrolase [Rhodobacteraceae bacterium]|nr:serine hydrolase [Paracoccaceae bacterium]
MIKQSFRGFLLACILVFSGATAWSAPYAAFVVDARTGEVLHARSADRRLAPASLTKMMTLYLAFVEIEAGRMSLDQMITISANAANEPPSKLGLRRGQRIQFRYLIRAAAIKSANDAATAIGEAISGSEAAFARYMTESAKAMGMNNTQFRNAHGLTQRGHYSTARDMAELGRRVFYDFPQYYNLFSRRTANAGIATVRHTNRRFLNAYEGSDGIKTGYTVAAGFNLVASARRGNERIIAVMFGGTSTAQRNGRVAELMNMGFSRAPSQAEVILPPRLNLRPDRPVAVAQAPHQSGVVPRATRPPKRSETVGILMARNIDDAIQSAAIEAALSAVMESATTGDYANPGIDFNEIADTGAPAIKAPPRRPDFGGSIALAAVAPLPEAQTLVRATVFGSTGSYAVQVGAFRNRNQAERLLIQTALVDIESFGDASRSITLENIQGISMYQARFVGMSATSAFKACDRLQSRLSDCAVIAPPS